MFKKPVFLVLAVSSLLILVLGCQAPQKKSVPPEEAKREALEAKVDADIQGPVQNPDDKNVIDKTDDWIKKNLW